MSDLVIELSPASFEELRKKLTDLKCFPDRPQTDALKLGPVRINKAKVKT